MLPKIWLFAAREAAAESRVDNIQWVGIKWLLTMFNRLATAHISVIGYGRK